MIPQLHAPLDCHFVCRPKRKQAIHENVGQLESGICGPVAELFELRPNRFPPSKGATNG
jgi:hypothetical protein